MAPTTAVCAVMIPVVTGVLFGERLAPLTILGIALAIVAIVLVSQQEAAASVAVRAGVLPPGIGLALASGVAIGLFFLALAETDARAGMWPLLAARAVSVTLFGRPHCRWFAAVLGFACHATRRRRRAGGSSRRDRYGPAS